MIYIVGVGGVGSWLAEAMVRLVDPILVTLIDGDTLEQKNLDRQLFTKDQIGMNKAVALGAKLGCRGIDQFFNPLLINLSEDDWIMCCVDNNPGRMAVLQAADATGCKVVFAANEVHSSEAYVYFGTWQDNQLLDPRYFYPEIATDNSGNPESERIGCTGEAQIANRQLVTANFMAAALAAHLYVVWAMERHKLESESLPYLPTRLHQNLTKNGFTNYELLDKEKKDAKS